MRKRTDDSPAVPDSTVLDVRALTLDPTNRRQRTDRGRQMIVASLRETGAARSIVIDERGEVLAGNGVAEAAPDAGIERVRIIDTVGDELIALRRRGLTPEQKRAVALYDNRTSELAVWDVEQLRDDKEHGLDLQPFWTDAEQAMLLGAPGVDADWNGMPSFEQQDLLAWRSLKVNFANQADYDRFAALVEQPLTERTRSIWFPAAAVDHVARDREFVGDEPDEGVTNYPPDAHDAHDDHDAQ